ncbi:hypothetical protein ACBJ59_02900 [Nonomuraea sp. MTCD27]|uniref:hypothetical protein n=1 Tax=Nonomuraea sp. MTCD27 TaxID=1676747 RepID=UPI0035C2359E
MRVRVHPGSAITEGRRATLVAVLDHSPEERVRVSAFTPSIGHADPTGWLEARLAERPRGAFPRASLDAVRRSSRSRSRGRLNLTSKRRPARRSGHDRADLRRLRRG